MDLFDLIQTSIYVTPVISEYLLNAFIKLTIRFQNPVQIDRIKAILAQSTGDLNVEIQQRAVEYGNLFQFDDIRKGVVERMPPPEIREENRVLGETPKKSKGSRKSIQVKPLVQKDLLDILGGQDETESPVDKIGVGDTARNAELLQDLFGSGPSANGADAPQQRSNVAAIMDLFGNSGISSSASPPTISAGGGSTLDGLFGQPTTIESTPPRTQSYRSSPSLFKFTLAPVVAYSKNDLTVSLQPTRTGPGRVSIQAVFRNDSIASKFEKVNMLVAVPKSQKLKLEPISSPIISVGEESTQSLRINAAQGVMPRNHKPDCRLLFV